MTGKGFGATEEEPDINNSIKLYSTFYDMANDQEVQPGCQNIVLHVIKKIPAAHPIQRYVHVLCIVATSYNYYLFVMYNVHVYSSY